MLHAGHRQGQRIRGQDQRERDAARQAELHCRRGTLQARQDEVARHARQQCDRDRGCRKIDRQRPRDAQSQQFREGQQKRIDNRRGRRRMLGCVDAVAAGQDIFCDGQVNIRIVERVDQPAAAQPNAGGDDCQTADGPRGHDDGGNLASRGSQADARRRHVLIASLLIAPVPPLADLMPQSRIAVGRACGTRSCIDGPGGSATQFGRQRSIRRRTILLPAVAV